MSKIEKIIDLFIGQGRTLIPEKNKVPPKGYRKGRTYTRNELLRYVKRGFNLGWVLGPRDLVLDVDPRNGGSKSYRKLCEKLGVDDLSQVYPTVVTGGGGRHFYMSLPRKFKPKQFRVEIADLPGLELKHEGLKVTIPGSLHKSGKRYRFDNQSPFKERPRPLKTELIKQYFKTNGHGPPADTKPDTELEVVTPKQLYKMLKCLPVEDYGLHEDWLNVMMAAHSATNGRGLKAFLKWSLKDASYADDAGQIAARWESLKANDGITVRTLVSEIRKYDASFDLKQIAALKVLLSSDLEQQLVNRLLKRKFQDGKHLIHAADQRYWRYTGTHWEVVAPNLISQYLLKEIEEYKHKNQKLKKPSAALLGNCERILRAEVASPQNLNLSTTARPSIVNTKNFEIWIDDEKGTFELKNHSPESYLTYCLETEYDPMAKCGRFDDALSEIFEPDLDTKALVRHYWEIVGYTIQNKKNIPIWVLFQGSGSNGKKVLLQVLSGLLGDAVSAKSVDELDTRRNNHALADLPGKLALIDDDVDSNAKLPDGMLKKISENKTMTANPKGSPTFSFQNTAIVIMAANNWPRTSDLSFGMRRRAHVFELKRVFSEREADLNLTDYIIQNELSGVLNRALAGLKRVRDRGRFKLPKSCKTAAANWFALSSQIHQYLDDCLTKEAGESVDFERVWDKYRSWTFDQGIRHPYNKSYFRRLIHDLNIGLRWIDAETQIIDGYRMTNDDDKKDKKD